MVPSREGFLVSYLGQNIYKIDFPDTHKIEALKNVIFKEDKIPLEILLAENQESFFYLDSVSNNDFSTTDQDLPPLIYVLTNGYNTENGLSFIHSDFETPSR